MKLVISKTKKINYIANDIERYVTNNMNAVEMHAFEQAMMDDPLLADAVDGYRSAVGAINVQTDLDELKQRLNPAEKKASVVTGFFKPWMRVAAGVAILLGVAVVMNRSFNETNKEIAGPVLAELTQTDTTATVQTETTVDTTTVAVNEKPAPINNPDVNTPIDPKKSVSKDSTANSLAKSEPAPVVTIPPVASGNTAPTASISKKEDIRFKELEAAEDKKQSNIVTFNKFSGVVVDENNQPVPFANITETKSGVGTYADVKGNFTLIAADSVIQIETKSVGYFSNSLQIRNKQTQRITLKDQSVIANAPTRERLYEKNKTRTTAMKTEVTEMYSEPADGWNNYGKYIANNLREGNLKEQRKPNDLKEVEVSFDVKPDGTVANLKVERSTCSNCNPEAIRIIKDGPKWKSKTGKTERTRFTVLF